MPPSPTSNKSKKFPQNFDLDALERICSEGEAGLGIALENLGNVLYSGGASKLLGELLGKERKSHLFEYIFSIIDDGMASVLREDLLAGFDCETSAGFSSSTIALDRIVKFLYCLPEAPSSAKADIQYIESSQAVLRLLYTLSRQFGDTVARQGEEEHSHGSAKPTKKKRSQAQAKQDKHSRNATPEIDHKPFEAIKEDVPTTESDTRELTRELLTRQKDLLDKYIDLLRDSSRSDIIRDQFKPFKTCTDTNTAPIVSDKHESGLSSTVTEVSSGLSPAYPHVQPLKASLYFDSAAGLGKWRIFLSTTACADLRSYDKNPKILKIILKKITELSNGAFSDDNHKMLNGPSKGIPIYEAKLTADLRLVYQVDCMSDYESKGEQTVLRLYGLFKHAQMDKNRMWASLSAQLATRGAEYRKRIIMRKKAPGEKGKVYIPQSWPESCETEEVTQDAGICCLVNTDDLQSIHQWLVLEKYSAFSQELLNCILADKDSSPVFAVSPYEHEIIEHPSSCYVLGRSGTGKTTTMAFKIFGMERAARTQPSSKPRQLFVTQSHVLAKRVKEYFAKLSEFLSASSMAPHELSAIPAQVEHDDGLVDPDDYEDGHGDLPRRFSELQDCHFPLFITFDKLCKLIEADLGISFARPAFTKEHWRAGRRFSLSSVRTNDELDDPEADYIRGGARIEDSTALSSERARSAFVSFESFRQNYWPHFPQDLVKKLDPALVYSEFLGVIKGSEESLKSEKSFISRDTYLGLSDRTRFTFASSRDRIYSLFENYLALKREYGDYDAADRTHQIISRMKEGYASSVDFLYVDEAQDNLIIDAFLLRSLCRNPNGLFWAGDTAQTIALGSSFRFDDLKASLYKFERELYPSISEKDTVVPAFFQLTKNYRSHNGIVNCAEIIIRLITHFWPHSIDALRPERGVVDGSKPVFFTGWNDETARYEQFLLGENGSSVEFGAHQCILVRDDQARNKLRKQIGDIGLLMTLYESKGLEFDDVLLYDFFEDSPCGLSQWRAILNFLNTTDENRKAAPRFDNIRHAGICTELKFFYVAVTRARKNLWIIDRSEKGEPMKTLLVESGRVTICTPENAPRLAESSSMEEWAKMGNALFGNKNYSQAMHCFERAELPFECAVSEAFLFRQQARDVPRGKSEKARIAAFLVASHAFFSCAQRSPLSQKKKYYHIAAECFQEAQADDLAAESYENAEEYTSAAKYYRKANLFDKAVEIVQTKEKLVDPVVAEKIIDASRLHYIHVRKLDKALKLFKSEEAGLEFMEDCGFDTARATIFEKNGRIHEAAEIYFFEGRSQQAIELLLKDIQNPQSIQQAVDYLLGDLWKQFAFGVEVKQRGPGAMDSLSFVRNMDKNLLSAEAKQEFAMFDALSKPSIGPRVTVYNNFMLEKTNLPATILILDHILRDTQQIEHMKAAIHFFDACFFYAKKLRQFWNEAHVTGDPMKRKLFGFRDLSDSEDEFLLTEGSLLSYYITESRALPYRRIETGLVLRRNELVRAIRLSIVRRLQEMVKVHSIPCSVFRKKFFAEPCLTYYTSQGQCNREDCHRLHFDLRNADAAWYNERVRAHLLQIMFLQAADFALTDYDRVTDYDRARIQREWLASLFNILNPPLLALGSTANISRKHVPEFYEGMEVVMIWIENRSFRIHPSAFTEWWFLSTIVEIATLALYQDRNKALSFIRHTRFFNGKTRGPERGATIESCRIPDLIRSLDTFDPDFILSGCIFIEHVVKFRLVINVGYLCRLVETLCTASVLLYRNMLYKFRDCILPRSWMAYLLPKLDFDQNYNLRQPIWLFVKRSAELMKHLFLSSGREIAHLLGTSAFNIRHLSIQRICRAICLVGCNTHYDLREYILHVFTELRGTQADLNTIPFRTRIYLQSQWTGLRRVVENSIPPSDLDGLVQLVQEGCDPSPMFSNVKVTRIVFKNKSDLHSLFDPARDGSSKLSATTASFAPKSLGHDATSAVQEAQMKHAEVIEDSFVTEEAIGTMEEREIGDDEQINVLDRPTETEDNKSATISMEERAALILQRIYRERRRVKAARTIQRNVKAWLAHRAELNKRGLCGKRAQFYNACRANDIRKQWPCRHHRVVYLGLVPHLLVCLDAIQGQVASVKNKAKRQLNGPDVDYDETSQQLKRATKNHKHVRQLKEKVDPMSEWHVKRKLEEVRSLVLDVSELLVQLKIDSVELDISLAMKAIVQERKPVQPKAKAKPQLNVDDLDGMYMY